MGRNAEASGAASLKGVAGVFSYSKTKGLFAGVSLEGSVLIERRDANEKLYGGRITGKQLLEGAVRPPPAADPLMRVLNSRVFSGNAANESGMYNDIPVYDDSHDDVVWEGRRGEGYGAGVRNSRSNTVGSAGGGGGGNNGGEGYEYRDNPRRTNSWADDLYDRSPSTRANPSETFDNMSNRSNRANSGDHNFGDSKPTRPTAPKPVFKQRTGSLNRDQAVALFTFDPDQDGDLGFKKGDIITITKRTENKTDWWTGRTEDGKVGIFPR